MFYVGLSREMDSQIHSSVQTVSTKVYMDKCKGKRRRFEYVHRQVDGGWLDVRMIEMTGESSLLTRANSCETRPSGGSLAPKPSAGNILSLS